jgi:hypothetical protein
MEERMLRRILYTAVIGAACVTVVVAPAWGHQIASNNGVSVQVHVNPNDEPVAGVPTTIWIVRVKPLKTGTFTWATCRCRLKVFDSSGAVVQDAPTKVARTPVTFPEAKAYGITFSGRFKRNGVWRNFKVSYAIRAGAPEGA